MENHAELIDWALRNSDKLHLKVTRLTGISEWLPNDFDYHVAITVAGTSVSGRGTDPDEPRAFLKAVAEAIERYACQGLEYPWATSTHGDRQQASLRAYRELLGMDRAMCHHFTGTKARSLDITALNCKGLADSLNKTCQKYGIILRLCELRPATDTRIVAAYAWQSGPEPPPGVLSGYGCADFVPEACRQAIIECVRKIGPIFIEREKPQEEMSELEAVRSPWWHIWKMSQETAGLDYLKDAILPAVGEAVSVTAEALSVKDVNFREIVGFKKHFPDVPCVVMQAYSDKLLVPQFGRATLNPGTIGRLKIFSGGTCAKIQTEVPHLYG